jgi:dimeric dUTPase (all-alpha-NTP-PPase superfamily)
MNWSWLFNAQRLLNADIEEKHPILEGEDRLGKKVLALQVELAECANEHRGFKFWSNKKPYKIISTTSGANIDNANVYRCGDCSHEVERDSDKFMKIHKDPECPECGNYMWLFRSSNPLLEEYVDCLHFILVIGLSHGITEGDFLAFEPIETADVNERFTDLMRFIWERKEIYVQGVELFIGLGKALGFTEEQIEEAYYIKNKINLQRQENGY